MMSAATCTRLRLVAGAGKKPVCTADARGTGSAGSGY